MRRRRPRHRTRRSNPPRSIRSRPEKSGRFFFAQSQGAAGVLHRPTTGRHPAPSSAASHHQRLRRIRHGRIEPAAVGSAVGRLRRDDAMLAKVGVHGVDPDFATLFRTLLIAVLLIGSGKWTDPRTHHCLPLVVRAGHGRVLGLPFPNVAARAGLAGGTRRQAQRGAGDVRRGAVRVRSAHALNIGRGEPGNVRHRIARTTCARCRVSAGPMTRRHTVGASSNPRMRSRRMPVSPHPAAVPRSCRALHRTATTGASRSGRRAVRSGRAQFRIRRRHAPCAGRSH